MNEKPAQNADTYDDSPTEYSKPTSSLRSWLFLVACGALMFWLVWQVNRRVDQFRDVPLRDLALMPLTGGSEDDPKSVTLEDVKGQVVVINYWGTWCPPCIQEFPHLVALEAKWRSNKDFQLLSVSCEGRPDTTFENLKLDTERFINKYGVTFPVYWDPRGKSQDALKSSLGLSTFGHPTTVVLDRRGLVQGFWDGYSEAAMRDLERKVQTLLEKN